MNTKLVLSALILILLATTVSAQRPRVFLLDANHLVSLKEKLKEKDVSTRQLVDSLEKEANSLLKMQPVSVMDKAFSPVSGNKHDYMSQAPYFWYDSSKPNGQPYLRRDGVRNPEIYKITDRTYLGRVESATRNLALAWYLTGNEKYAAKAATLLKTWFLDDATKMNPHLEYGQAIPGINTGRGIGIIETIALTNIADAAGLLAGSAAWTAADEKALQAWYASYLDWLLTSKNGKDEMAAKNNHGTWYSVQVIDFALYTGNMSKAKQLAEESKKRADTQIGKDGRMQLELDRTNGLGYSTMNLQAWVNLATLSEQTNTDLWKYKTPEGAGIATAVDWLAPYALGKKSWTYDQINKYNKSDMYPILLQAARKYSNMNYVSQAKEIQQSGVNWQLELLHKY